MSQDEFEGNWKQIRGQAQQRWGKLTDDDLKLIGGKWEQFVSILQAKYGYTRETVEFEFTQALAQFSIQQRHKQRGYQASVLDIAEDQWKQMHNQARVWWSKLTDEELEKTAGKAKAIFALLQAEYGYSSDSAEAEFKRRVKEYALSQQAHPVPESLFILKN